MDRSLHEMVFAQSSADIFSGPPGFHKLIGSDHSAVPRPLVSIPGVREESWAPGFHIRRVPVHDLGIYIRVGITIVDQGYLFDEDIPVFQPDVVVPYIRPFARELKRRQVLREGRPVVVAYDRGYPTYGHFLIDFLPRLIIAERMLGRDFGGAAVLIPSELPGWGTKILNDLFPGVKTLSFDGSQHSLKLSAAIIPTHCHINYMFHPFARDIFDAMKERVEPLLPDRTAEFIFISRSGVPSLRTTEDIEVIEKYAETLGACVVKLHTLSWREQLGYFMGAKLVVGEYGSGLHNTVFSANGVRTISLNRLQFLQSFIGALNSQRLTYVLPTKLDTSTHIKNAVFNLEEVKRALDHAVAHEFKTAT